MKRTANRVQTKTSPSGKKTNIWPFLAEYLNRFPASSDELISPLLERRLLPATRSGLSRVCTYHFLQDASAAASPPSRNINLGHHGENLASVVHNLERNSEGKIIIERGLEKLRLAVPSMKNVNVQKYPYGGNLGLWFQESNDVQWEAPQVSEGTLTFFAMLISIMDPMASVVAIDEPENSIHPWMLSVLINTCREEIAKRQIFLTTHSPVLVDEANFEEIYIVSRNLNGETQITNASTEYPEFKDRKKEYGQLWLNGMIDGIPSGQMEFD